MASSNILSSDHAHERAGEAIRRVVAVFCERCAAAQDALTADNWEKFDELFHLQRVAWLNLNALVGKFESSFDSEVCKPAIQAWLEPCKSASNSLMSEMAQKLSRIEGEGRAGGRLKRHLAAFQAGSVNVGNFLKGT